MTFAFCFGTPHTRNSARAPLRVMHISPCDRRSNFFRPERPPRRLLTALEPGQSKPARRKMRRKRQLDLAHKKMTPHFSGVSFLFCLLAGSGFRLAAFPPLLSFIAFLNQSSHLPVHNGATDAQKTRPPPGGGRPGAGRRAQENRRSAGRRSPGPGPRPSMAKDVSQSGVNSLLRKLTTLQHTSLRMCFRQARGRGRLFRWQRKAASRPLHTMRSESGRLAPREAQEMTRLEDVPLCVRGCSLIKIWLFDCFPSS